MCRPFKTIFRFVVIPLLLALLSPYANAQANVSAEAGRAAMSKLSTLVGEWEGEATVTMGPGQIYRVKQREHVQYKLDGNLLLIEGTGQESASEGEGRVVFQALAVCTFDAMTKKYQFHAFRDNGMSKLADWDVTDTGFIWGFEDGRGGKVRYTITVSDDTWTEVGEYLMEGMPPRKIFEMTVKRISASK